MRTQIHLADKYFSLLKPLDNETKKRLVLLLVNSIETQEDKSVEVKERKGSLLDLYGMWADNPDADAMEETIRNCRKDPHTRNIVAFD